LEGQNFGLNTVETSFATFACGSVAFRKRRQLSSFRKHMPGVSGTFAPPTAAAAKLM
jgi:hypothetical protein